MNPQQNLLWTGDRPCSRSIIRPCPIAKCCGGSDRRFRGHSGLVKTWSGSVADHPGKKGAHQAWLDGMSQRQISAQFNVSRSTIQDWIKNDWRPKLVPSSVGKALATRIVGAVADIDSNEILENALRSLSGDMSIAPVRSREGAATAIARLVELHRKLNPLTMDELADLAVNTPGFSVDGFVLALRARLERG